MDWNAATWWWVVTGMLVAAELATGTFYLLMFALGTAAAALAAHAGLPWSGQLACSALIGGGSVALWHLRRSRQPAGPPAHEDRNVNLDIGERVTVAAWDADGNAVVTYRGATWQARHAGTGAPQAGEHVIRGVEGTRLLLERRP